MPQTDARQMIFYFMNSADIARQNGMKLSLLLQLFYDNTVLYNRIPVKQRHRPWLIVVTSTNVYTCILSYWVVCHKK